jgi:hypothetical protein
MYNKKYYFRNADFIAVHITRKNGIVLEYETAVARMNKLTPRSRFLPEKLMFAQMEKYFLLFIKFKGSSPYSQEPYPYPESCESTTSYSFHFNTVTCIPIARQRLGKYIPAGATRNNRIFVARRRISKDAWLTIKAVFSAWSVQSCYKEVFSSVE